MPAIADYCQRGNNQPGTRDALLAIQRNKKNGSDTNTVGRVRAKECYLVQSTQERAATILGRPKDN